MAGRMLYDHIEAGRDLSDLVSDTELLAELRTAYADRDWIDYGRIIEELRDPATDHAEGSRYFLNRAVVSSDQWLAPAAIGEAIDKTKEIKPREAVTLGIDASWNDDSTVLTATRVADGHTIHVASWHPDLEADGYELPLGEVDEEVRAAFDRWDVIRLYADPPYLQGLLVAWIEDFGKDKIVPWWTNRDAAMAGALQRIETAINAGEDFSIDGHPILVAHFTHCRVHRKRARVADPDGKHERKLIRKPVPRGHDKIDGAVSATLSYEARADVIAAGLRPKEGFVTVASF